MHVPEAARLCMHLTHAYLINNQCYSIGMFEIVSKYRRSDMLMSHEVEGVIFV